jgi:DNA-binding MurR/RpiR family transcriptional regulator
MFIIKLKQVLPDLTYSENLIANYLISNKQDLNNLTSYDLAKKVEVGQATIIRFSKKLGYNSYKEMLLDIVNNDCNDFDNSEVQEQESTVETLEKLKYCYNMVLDEILRFNSVGNIDQIVDALYYADKIFCYGAQSSNTIAELFANKLLEIGKEAYNSKDTFVGVSLIRNMSEKDVVFLVSGSGGSKSTIQLAKLAKERGITVICITGLQNNPLKELATYSLNASEYLLYTNLKSVTNRCSQLYLVDCLFLNLWKKNATKYNKQIMDIGLYFQSEFGYPCNFEQEDNDEKEDTDE